MQQLRGGELRQELEKQEFLGVLKGRISSQKGPVRFLFIDGPCLGDCIFCSHKNEAVTPLKEIESRFDCTVDEGAICLIGNEPLLHPEILDIVSICKTHGFSEIEIMTSGLQLKEIERSRKLVEFGVCSFSIPLHAASSEIHDAITRVPGGFSAVVRGIKNSIECGASVYVHTTLIQQNALAIPALENFVRQDLGSHFSVFPLRPKSSGLPFFRLAVPLQKARELAPYGLYGFPRCVSPVDTGMPSKSMKAYFLCQDFQMHEKCGGCGLRASCPGLFMDYVNIFGENEIAPISCLSAK